MTDIYIVPSESRTYVIPLEVVETIADRTYLIPAESRLTEVE